MRKLNFDNNEYYHIYNRGVDQRDIFMNEGDYERFLSSLRDFNSLEPIGSLYEKAYRDKVSAEKAASEVEKERSEEELSSQLGTKFLVSPSHSSGLVEFICYCLNPNHYHFILKQLADKGISKFLHKVSLGYTNYFNLKYQRCGSLYQGPFKARQIGSFDDLVWLSVYVNKNAQIHGITQNAAQYPWCSFSYYLGIKDDDICNKDSILNEVRDYKNVADDAALFMRKKKEMEKHLME